jgi:transposase
VSPVRDGMRRPVYDRSLGSVNQFKRTRSAIKETGMKKNSSSSARPKQKGPAESKKTSVKTTTKLTVGIDLGDTQSNYCILDAEGDVLSEGTIRTTEGGFEQQFQSMKTCRIALETGTHSPWVSRQLETYGHDVIVANSRQVRLIYESDRKNDKVDARTLARLARIDKDLLHPIRHRGEKAQADLSMLRARDTLVQVRTKLINCARGMVKSVGGRLPSASGDYFARKSREHIPEAISDALTPVLDQIEQITAQLREYHKRIEKMAETEYAHTALMRQFRRASRRRPESPAS